MTYRLRISPEAAADLKEIKLYIETELDNPPAALNTVSKIIRSIRGLEGFPGRGAPLSSIIDMQTDYRFLVCDSYLIFYRSQAEQVFVLRVLYGKRDYIKILFHDLPEDQSRNSGIPE